LLERFALGERGGAVVGAADVEAAFDLAVSFVVGELLDGEGRVDVEAGVGGVGVVDLGFSGGVGADGVTDGELLTVRGRGECGRAGGFDVDVPDGVGLDRELGERGGVLARLRGGGRRVGLGRRGRAGCRDRRCGDGQSGRRSDGDDAGAEAGDPGAG
jgi:hypothetical protein